MDIDIERLKVDESLWPEGATHFVAGGSVFSDVFWRVEDDAGVEAWAVGMSELVHYPDPFWPYESLPKMIPRPAKTQAPEWYGEFPPPIGSACECTFAIERNDRWHKGEVVLHGIDPEGRRYFVVDTGAYQPCFRSVARVRPIRTKERRERDETIEAAERVIEFREGQVANSTHLEWLYEVGLLRLPEVGNEGN